MKTPEQWLEKFSDTLCSPKTMSKPKDDGGPAWNPQALEATLRDLFAMAALMSTPSVKPQDAATMAYEIADAMIAERNK